MMPGQLRARADDNRLSTTPYFHRVIGDEPMAADDEIQGALALADAALPHDEYAQPENVEQDGVNDLTDRQRVLEDRGELGNRLGRGRRRAQQRHVHALG